MFSRCCSKLLLHGTEQMEASQGHRPLGIPEKEQRKKADKKRDWDTETKETLGENWKQRG